VGIYRGGKGKGKVLIVHTGVRCGVFHPHSEIQTPKGKSGRGGGKKAQKREDPTPGFRPGGRRKPINELKEKKREKMLGEGEKEKSKGRRLMRGGGRGARWRGELKPDLASGHNLNGAGCSMKERIKKNYFIDPILFWP